MEDSMEARPDWISQHGHPSIGSSSSRPQCNAYAPIASFEDLSDEHDTSLSYTRVPDTPAVSEEIRGLVSAMASNETIYMLTESPVSLSISMSGGSQSHSQAETPQTPRIDVVNASSSCSSAHSSDSREFFSSTEDLRHGFLEANYETDLKQSTEDLGASAPETHRSKAYLYSQVTPDSQLELARRKSWDGGRNSSADLNRKVSSCSSRSAETGRTSRIYRERLGSFNSADSRMNLLPSSQSNRGSAVSVAMLETSFCGSKTSLVDCEGDLEPRTRQEQQSLFGLEKSSSASSVLQPFFDQQRKPQWKIAPINITESSLSFRRQSQTTSPLPGRKSPLPMETSFCGSRILVHANTQNDEEEEQEQLKRSQVNSPMSRKTSLTVNFDKLPHISYQTEPRSRPASPSPSILYNNNTLTTHKEPIERLLSGSSVTSSQLNTYGGEETSEAAPSLSMEDEEVSTSERNSSSLNSLVHRVPQIPNDASSTSSSSSSDEEFVDASQGEVEHQKKFNPFCDNASNDHLLEQQEPGEDDEEDDNEAAAAEVKLGTLSPERFLRDQGEVCMEPEAQLPTESGYNATFVANFSPSMTPTSETFNSSLAGSSEFLETRMPNGDAEDESASYTKGMSVITGGISAESLERKSSSSGEDGTQPTPPSSTAKTSKKPFANSLSALQRAFNKKDRKSANEPLEGPLSKSASREQVKELRKESLKPNPTTSNGENTKKNAANDTTCLARPQLQVVPPPALVPAEERSFAKQESLDEELPFVPTTLPQERSIIAPMTPISLRTSYTVSTSPRPRPRPSIDLRKTNFDEYLVMIQNSAKVEELTAERRLRLTLPSKIYYSGDSSSIQAQILRQSTEDSN